MVYQKLSGFSDEIAESVEEQFAALKRLGIGYFEPRGIDGKNIADLTDEEVEQLKEKMKRYGIQASSIGSPIGKVKLEEDFETHFTCFCRVVEIAKMLDCRYIRLFSFYHEGEVWTAEEREEVLARLGRMIAYAKEQGVILLHENEKDIYGDTADRCIDLMRELACESFRAVFDPANFIQSKQDTLYAYEHLKDDIAYMHIKDAMLADGSVVPAGAGDGQVQEILTRLLRSGYDGFLSLEPHLGNFTGLAALELDDAMKNLPQGGEGTFTLAYRALQAILEKI